MLSPAASRSTIWFLHFCSDHTRTNAPSPPLGTMRAEGIIRNVNTLEDFKNTDKAAMLRTAGRQVFVVSIKGGPTLTHSGMGCDQGW